MGHGLKFHLLIPVLLRIRSLTLKRGQESTNAVSKIVGSGLSSNDLLQVKDYNFSFTFYAGTTTVLTMFEIPVVNQT